jgi:hypothetical protein
VVARGIAALQKLLPKSSSNQPIAQEQVKQELTTAWQFTKEKVFPAILSGVSFVVDRLDPPMAQVGQKLRTAIQSNSSWQKLVASPLWQKSSIALAPIFRSIGEVWTKAVGNIELSDQVKHITSKKAALTSLLILFLAISLLKPAPAATAPRPKGKPPAITKAVSPAIENALQAVVQPFGEGLLQSIAGNTQIGRLALELGDGWYQLSTEQQDQLVSLIQQKADRLRFTDVLISDSAHHLLARPAVVGKAMIIVRR